MTLAADTQLMNVLVRMVVPMRREFGQAIDVQQIRSNATYARGVVQQASTSQVERLREYALFVDRYLQGEGAAQGRMPSARPSTPVADATSALRGDAAHAARQLLDMIGPAGEPMAIQFEGVSDVDAARRLAARACDLVAERRGRRLAQTYREQLPASLT